MKYLFQKITIFLLLSGSIFNAHAQINKVVRSNEKIVVAGKYYYLHIVREKQTMYSICKAYDVNIKDVLEINKKETPNLELHEILRIPFLQSTNTDTINTNQKSSKFFYYVIQKGNTLYSLSKQFNQPVHTIMLNNPEIGENGKLTVGTVLKIPKQASIPTVKKPKTTYKVTANNSESDILDKFNIKRRAFRKLNPHINSFRNIPAGTIVNIGKDTNLSTPITAAPKDSTIKIKQTTDYNQIFKEYKRDSVTQTKINIALFLPLYAALSDSLNWELTYKDNQKIMMRKDPETVYPYARDFIRLYQGVLLAVEDLKKQGLQINLHVFDTEKKQSTVRKTLKQLESQKLDLILGPVYSNTFELVAEYAQTHQIPIVSPLSSKNDQILDNPFVFQLNTSIESLCENISNYITTIKDNINVVIVHGKNYKELEEYKLVLDIEQQLFENGKYWRNNKLSYKKISFEDYGNLGLEHILSKTKENIIIIPSSKPAVVESFLTNIKILSKSYPIKLIGFPSWQRYNSMDPSNLFELNTQILSPYFIDYSSKHVNEFIDRFRYQFNCEPNDYAFRAYDFTLYFSNAINRYGILFSDHLNKIKDIKLLQSNFNLKNVSAWGGFENRGLKLISFNKNFELKAKNFEPTVKTYQHVEQTKPAINQD